MYDIVMHSGRRPWSCALRGAFVPATAVVLLCLLLVVVSIAAVHALDIDHGHAHASDDCGVCSAVLLAEPVIDTPHVDLLTSPEFTARGVAISGAQVASPRSRRAHRARGPPAHS